jgi:RNA polymerase sigma factor (sigma-70 family)
MVTGSLAGVVPRLRSVALASHGAMSDAELLDRFVAARDGRPRDCSRRGVDDGEAAFEVMVRRHGPMVFAVCRRVLRHAQDAEDAFQATFLVLAHKAASVSPRNKLAGWLHGVAHRTALKARHRAARRSEVEKKVPPRGQEPMQPDTTDPNWDEVEPLLDQELAALPERYRLPIILCDLEGRLRSEVAASLGCSEGTLSSRLTRGRRLLAERLKRRGVCLSGAAVALVLTERSAALAEPLIRATVPAAVSSVSASAAGVAAVSPNVAHLAKGVMKSMFLQKLQTVAVAAVAAAAVAVAVMGVAAYRGQAAPVPKTAPAPALDEKALNDSLADVEGRLLMNRKVLKDLKCDFDQFDKIMDILEEAEKKAQQKTSEAMGQLRFNAAGAGPANIEQMIRDAQAEGEKEFRKAVGGVVTTILTPAQRQRLREIDLQARGHDAFATPAVAKVLELTANQKEQMEANAKKVEEDIAQAFQNPAAVVNGAVGRGAAGGGGGAGGRGNVVGGGGFGGVDYEKVVRDARAEGMKRALAILTDEQKATWKKLVGEPFTHPLNIHKGPQSGGFKFGGGGFGGKVAPPLPALPGNVLPLPPGGAGGAKPVLPPPIDPGN